MSLFVAAIAVFCIAAAVFFAAVFVGNAVGSQVSLAQEEAEPQPDYEEEPEPGIVKLIFLRWSRRIAPVLPTKFRERTERNIVMAGGLSGYTAAQMGLSVVLLALLGGAFGALCVVALEWSGAAVALGLIGGAMMPFIWLRDQVKGRHLEILSDLPYHLDLLTLSVEAGLDFAAGVAKLVEKGKPGALRDEFRTFLSELRIGKTRAEAMASMSERVGLPALSSFLSALIQAERMGSGIGRTLRIQAEQLRSERFQRAEKLANEAPVKMLIPLVLFIFPTIWIILGAPLIFQWIFMGVG